MGSSPTERATFCSADENCDPVRMESTGSNPTAHVISSWHHRLALCTSHLCCPHAVPSNRIAGVIVRLLSSLYIFATPTVLKWFSCPGNLASRAVALVKML